MQGRGSWGGVTQSARFAQRACARVCDIGGVPRQPREDRAGDVQHVFVRGNARSAVALDSADHERALRLLEGLVSRFELICHAWCYLPNHFHLLVTSRLGNLSNAMHWLGTCGAHAFNQRHDRSGHVYQGRFGSRLVESEAHFLELARYLPLNPVRAGLCRSPEDWRWSSYAPTAGLRPVPWFLDPGEIIGMLGGRDAYVAWVGQGVDPTVLDEHGFRQPPPRPSLESLLAVGGDEAVAAAQTYGYTQTEIAHYLGVSQSQVSRRLAAYSGVRHA
jgi:REP element-mobilizing transposase RayT